MNILNIMRYSLLLPLTSKHAHISALPAMLERPSTVTDFDGQTKEICRKQGS
jgi:hypothetical protein